MDMVSPAGDQNAESARSSRCWRSISLKNNFIRPARLVWWATTLAWAGLIFYLSTQTFAPDFSQRFLAEILAVLHCKVSPATFGTLHIWFRKLAHLTEYAIFALLLYAYPDKAEQALWRPNRALTCILIAALYSLTDEYHQLFVPKRHSSLLDCGLDTLGASLAMLLLFIQYQVKHLRVASVHDGDILPDRKTHRFPSPQTGQSPQLESRTEEGGSRSHHD